MQTNNIVIINESYCYTCHAMACHTKSKRKEKLKFMRNGNIKNKNLFMFYIKKKAITNKSFELLTLYFVVSSMQCLCLSMTLSLLCTLLIFFLCISPFWFYCCILNLHWFIQQQFAVHIKAQSLHFITIFLNSILLFFFELRITFFFVFFLSS